jgi:hypothetical protein
VRCHEGNESIKMNLERNLETKPWLLYMGYGIWDMGYGIWDMGYGRGDGCFFYALFSFFPNDDLSLRSTFSNRSPNSLRKSRFACAISNR